MRVIKVEGMPVSKLKEQYVVLVIQSEREFQQLMLESSGTVFFDQQKAYSIIGKTCYVLFHGGKSDFFNEWVSKSAE